MHLLTLCRLATVKAADKLQALADSPQVDQLTLVRHRPVPLETQRVKVTQVNYLPHYPDSVHTFTPWMRIRNHLGMLWAAFWAIRQHQPDVIYGIFMVPYGLFAWLLSRWYGKPCIISLIGTDLNDYTLRRFTARFFQWMLTHVEVITVVDGDAGQRLLAATRVKPAQVMILPNAVDLSAYLAPHDHIPRDFEAVYVGRLLDMKEPENLIETWFHVVAKKPSARLALVGDGVMRPQLEAMSARLGLQNNLLFVGWVDDVPQWVHRAKIFLSVSSQEGVPTALIEAMAGGLVPVHTRVGGVPFILRDGENGLLVDYPTDPKQVAQKILRLLDDPALYARLQAQALTIQHDFSLAGVTEAWNEILQHPGLQKKGC
jgi:glycosyltransferase involved in cell wall biosynthesis